MPTAGEGRVSRSQTWLELTRRPSSSVAVTVRPDCVYRREARSRKLWSRPQGRPEAHLCCFGSGLIDLTACVRPVFVIARQGNYLGIDVAVKEVLPSKDYEVSKYFEREWRIMKSVCPRNRCDSVGDQG